jgi:hypothetical protein
LLPCGMFRAHATLLCLGMALAPSFEGLASEPAQIPTGFAMNELNEVSSQPAEVRARGALVQASLRGGQQGGVASVPASATYVVLSVFMGGAATPRDLTFPAESVK